MAFLRITVEVSSPAIQRKLEMLKNVWGSRPGQQCLVDIEQIIREDNKQALLEGLDKQSRPFEALRSKRTGKYKGATGPPLAPFYEASRVIKNFRVQHIGFGTDWEIVMGWQDFDLIRYHIQGLGPLPRRDPSGVRMRTHYKIKARIAQMKEDLKAYK